MLICSALHGQLNHLFLTQTGTGKTHLVSPTDMRQYRPSFSSFPLGTTGFRGRNDWNYITRHPSRQILFCAIYKRFSFTPWGSIFLIPSLFPRLFPANIACSPILFSPLPAHHNHLLSADYRNSIWHPLRKRIKTTIARIARIIT